MLSWKCLPFAIVFAAFVAQPADATWSIVAADSETQEVVVASATCLTGWDLKRWTPVIVVGKGGGATQATIDLTGVRRLIIWDGLLAGSTAQEIIDQLNELPDQNDHQHGVAEAEIGTSATKTGNLPRQHKSGVTGSFGTVWYAIQGNVLTGRPVVTMAEDAFVNTPGDLPAKTMAAMEAARSMGGDGRCSCDLNNPTGCGSPPANFDKSAHIGYMLVARFGDTDDPACTPGGCADGDYFMAFNIAFEHVPDPDPVYQLQELFDLARVNLLGRPDAIASNVSFTAVGGSGDEWLIRVDLNDWQGVLLGESVQTFTVEHAPDSDQATSIGPVVDLGDGSYEVTLTKTGQLGVDVFLITADDGIRPVVLPPRRATLDMAEAPSDFYSYFPAAAVAAGAAGAFFQTDVEINNKGMDDASVWFWWLPRGADNSDPVASTPITLGPGESMQYPNALNAIFGLDPDSVGAVAMVSDSMYVIGMSRTYNIPVAKVAGTFGQALPAVPYDELIMTGEIQRIIFMSEDIDFRANLGCINGTAMDITVDIELFNDLGQPLETIAMGLSPYSNKQINRIFRAYMPVNGYVDVSSAVADAAFYCYGSVLDNETSDPTSVLPQVPSHTSIFIPAAALAAGAEGAFFQTDVDLNNTSDSAVTYTFKWLPRGQDNSAADESEQFSLGDGMGVRLENVLTEVFGLEPDSLGALSIETSSPDLLAMSRTYNIPAAELAGTFGQALPGVHMNQMIPSGEKKRIIFMTENDEFRANLGCVNGVASEITVKIDMFDSLGEKLETKVKVLAPYSNKQINKIFQSYAPVQGYVDVWTDTADAYVYCYGSVLDNETSDPTTVLPQ